MLFMLKDGPEEMLVKFVTNLLTRIVQGTESDTPHTPEKEETEAQGDDSPRENLEEFILNRL